MEIVTNNSQVEDEVNARTWLNAHKAEQGLSWTQIAKLTDVASSTLSLFSAGNYTGDNAKIAGKIMAYQSRLTAQAAIRTTMPTVPAWYDTATSARLADVLQWAQSGEIVMIVTSPGVGKTHTAKRFAAADPNVWLATMSPSTAGVAARGRLARAGPTRS